MVLVLYLVSINGVYGKPEEQYSSYSCQTICENGNCVRQCDDGQSFNGYPYPSSGIPSTGISSGMNGVQSSYGCQTMCENGNCVRQCSGSPNGQSYNRNLYPSAVIPSLEIPTSSKCNNRKVGCDDGFCWQTCETIVRGPSGESVSRSSSKSYAGCVNDIQCGADSERLPPHTSTPVSTTPPPMTEEALDMVSSTTRKAFPVEPPSRLSIPRRISAEPPPPRKSRA